MFEHISILCTCITVVAVSSCFAEVQMIMQGARTESGSESGVVACGFLDKLDMT